MSLSLSKMNLLIINKILTKNGLIEYIFLAVSHSLSLFCYIFLSLPFTRSLAISQSLFLTPLLLSLSLSLSHLSLVCVWNRNYIAFWKRTLQKCLCVY